MMAGAPCPVEIMKRVVREMHCEGMTVGYGQTESSPIITMSAVHDSLERRVSTVGQACANTEVKIVSSSGETVPVGEARRAVHARISGDEGLRSGAGGDSPRH
jgi:fatty-acyl-CoA synthase